MKIRQRIFGEPRLGEFAVLQTFGDDGPDFVFAQRLGDGAPGVARLGGLARKTRVGGKQNLHVTSEPVPPDGRGFRHVHRDAPVWAGFGVERIAGGLQKKMTGKNTE